MSVKLLFVRSEGKVFAENVRATKAQIETEDGNHPITNRGIYRHRRGKWPAIMVIWQGRNSPEGETADERVTKAMISESDYTKIHKQKPSVSKRWVRAMVRYFMLFVEVLIIGFLMVVLWVLLWVIFGVML